MRLTIRNQDTGFQTCIRVFWQIQWLSEEQESENTSVCEMMAQLFSLSLPVIRNRLGFKIEPSIHFQIFSFCTYFSPIKNNCSFPFIKFCTNLSSSLFSMSNKMASSIEQASRPSAQGLEIWETNKHLFQCGCQYLGHSSMADLPVSSVLFSWAATLHFSIGGFCTRNLTKTLSPIRLKRRRISPAQPDFRAKWCQCGHRQASGEKDGEDACLYPGHLNGFTLPWTFDVSIVDRRWELWTVTNSKFWEAKLTKGSLLWTLLSVSTPAHTCNWGFLCSYWTWFPLCPHRLNNFIFETEDTTHDLLWMVLFPSLTITSEKEGKQGFP